MSDEELSPDQELMLRWIGRNEDHATWYTLGRATLGDLTSPAVLTQTLRSLVERGLVREEQGVEGKPARLSVTQAGHAWLTKHEQS